MSTPALQDVTQTPGKIASPRLTQKGWRTEGENYLAYHKGVAIAIFVDEHLGGDWTIHGLTLPHKKENANTATWRVSVAA
jgi:hypothetical protein